MVLLVLLDSTLTLTTPALLFPALSLLLLAYTNRFMSLAGLIRRLHEHYLEDHNDDILSQIKNLKLRIRLIRDMQILGIISMFFDVLAMILVYLDFIKVAKIIFGLGLILLLVSLAFSIWEIYISTQALNIHIRDIEEQGEKRGFVGLFTKHK